MAEIQVSVDLIAGSNSAANAVKEFLKSLNSLHLPKDMLSGLEDKIKDFEKVKSDFDKLVSKGITSKKDENNVTKLATQMGNMAADIYKAYNKIKLPEYNEKAQKVKEERDNAYLQAILLRRNLILKDALEQSKLQDLQTSKVNLKGTLKAQYGKILNLTISNGNYEKAIESLTKTKTKIDAVKDVSGASAFGLSGEELKNASSELERILGILNELKNFKFDFGFGDIKESGMTLSEFFTKIDPQYLTQLKEINEELVKAKENTDEAGKALKNEGSSLKELAGDFKLYAESTREANDNAELFKQKLVNLFSIGSAALIFRRTVTEAFNSVKELDKLMTETAVVTNFDVSDLWGQLDNYAELASSMGAKISDAYKTMTLYYQQGLNTDLAFAVGEETMKMARIGGMDYTEATNMMTAALRGFNMEIDKMSAQKVNDVYSELAAISAADTNEISTAMTKTASIAKSANMEFETTAALLTQIIETTRESPETAGTAMKTVIARFSEVKDLYSKGELTGVDAEGEAVSINKIDTALKSVGISLNKFILGEEGLDDVFLKLASKWDSLDMSTLRYIATQAAGSRLQSRFIAMMSDYPRTLELVESAENSEGASTKQFEKTLESLESKLNSLSNAWNSFTMSIANSDMIKGAVDALTKLLETINNLTDRLAGGSEEISGFWKILMGLGIFKSGQSLVNKTGLGKSITGILGKFKSYSSEAEGIDEDFDIEEKIATAFESLKGKSFSGIKGSISNFFGNSFGSIKNTWRDALYGDSSEEYDDLENKYKSSRSYLDYKNFKDYKKNTQANAINKLGSVGGKALTVLAVAGNATVGTALQEDNNVEQKTKDTTLATLNGLALTGLAISIGSSLIPGIWGVVLGATVGVIATLAMGISAAFETAEEKSKRIAQEFEDSKNSVSEAKKATESVSTDFDNVKTLTSEVMNTAEGTVERTNAVLEANNASWDLIEKYGLTAEDYSINKDGVVELNEDTLAKVLKQKNQELENKQYIQLASALEYEIDLKNVISRDYDEDLSTIESRYLKGKYKDLSTTSERLTAFFNEQYSTGKVTDADLEGKDNIIAAMHELSEQLQKVNTQKQLTASSYLRTEGDIEGNANTLLSNVLGDKIDENEYNTKLEEKEKEIKELSDTKARAKYAEEVLGNANLDTSDIDIDEIHTGLAKIETFKDILGEAGINADDYIDAYLSLSKELKKTIDQSEKTTSKELNSAIKKAEADKNDKQVELLVKQADLVSRARAKSANEFAQTLANSGIERNAYDIALIGELSLELIDNLNTWVKETASFGTEFLDALLNDGLYSFANNDERFSDLMSEINWSSLINALNSVNDLVEEGVWGAEEMQAALKKNADSATMVRELYSSSSIDDIVDKAKELADTEEISAQDVEDLGDEFSIVNDLLETGEVTSGSLAKILEGISKGDFSLDSLTDSLVEALNTATLLDSLLATAFDNIDEFDPARSTGDIADAYKEYSETFFENIKNNLWDENTLDYFEQFAGKTGRELLESKIVELSTKYGENTPQFNSRLESYLQGNNEQNLNYKRLLNKAKTGDWTAMATSLSDVIKASDKANLKEDSNYLSLWDQIFIKNRNGSLSLNAEDGQTTDQLVQTLSLALGGNTTLAENMVALITLNDSESRSKLGANDFVAAEKTYLDKVQSGELINRSDLELLYNAGGKYLRDENNNLLYNDSDAFVEAKKKEYLQLSNKNIYSGYDTSMATGNAANDLATFESKLEKNNNGTMVSATLQEALGATGNELTTNGSLNLTQITEAFEKLGLSESDATRFAEEYATQLAKTNSAVQRGKEFCYDYIDALGEVKLAYGETAEAAKEAANAALEQSLKEAQALMIANAFATALTDTEAAVTFKVNEDDVKKYDPEDKDAEVIFEANYDAVLSSTPPTMHGTLIYDDIQYSGSGVGAFGSGIAYASGSYNAKEGSALVGELGSEMVVDPHSGQWYTVGDTGAEFTNLPKDAIVFNHKLTEGLLKYGHINNRGLAKASGTAFASGNAFAWGRGSSVAEDPLGDSDEEWENPFDKFYNLIDLIAREEREQTRLQRQLETLERKREQADNYNDLAKALKNTVTKTLEQIDKATSLIANNQELFQVKQKELADYMEENSSLLLYATYDSKTNRITIDWDKILALDDANNKTEGDKVKDYVDKLEDLRDQVEDAEDAIYDNEDTIREATDTLQDTIDEAKSTYTEFEQSVYDAIVSARQKEIDDLSELYSVQDNNNSKILSGIQQVVDEQRKLRDLQDARDDIEEKQNRLALLMRDTSGANDLEIKALQEEISDAQESYTDSLVDNAIDEISLANEEASEQRNHLIELMQQMLEYDQESGAFWQATYELIASGIDEEGKLAEGSALYDLLALANNVAGMSQYGQLAWYEEANQNFINALAGLEYWENQTTATELLTELLSSYLTLIGGTLEEEKEAVDWIKLYLSGKEEVEELKEEAKTASTAAYVEGTTSYSTKTTNGKTEEVKDNNELTRWKTNVERLENVVDKTIEQIAELTGGKLSTDVIKAAASGSEEAIKLITQNTTLGSVANALLSNIKNTNKLIETAKTKLSQEQTAQDKGFNSYSEYQTYLEKKRQELAALNGYSSGSKGGYTSIGYYYTGNGNYYKNSSGELFKKESYGTSSNFVQITKASSKNYKKYDTGGYTGDWQGDSGKLAVLHKKELVLDAADTKNFLMLKDILRDMELTNSDAINGDTYYDVHIDVDKLTSDYDVEDVADKVKEMIAKDASYRNNNTINLKR